MTVPARLSEMPEDDVVLLATRIALRLAGVDVRLDEDGEILEIVLVPRGAGGTGRPA